MVGCGQTSATWLPSTMRLPPSTRPSGSRERRSSAFIREDSGDCLTPTKVKFTHRRRVRCRTRLRRPFSIARYWSDRKIHPNKRPTELPLDETGVEFDADKID